MKIAARCLDDDRPAEVWRQTELGGSRNVNLLDKISIRIYLFVLQSDLHLQSRSLEKCAAFFDFL